MRSPSVHLPAFRPFTMLLPALTQAHTNIQSATDGLIPRMLPNTPALHPAVVKHYHLVPGGGNGCGSDMGGITTPSAAVRASSVPVSCKAMLQKLPLRVGGPRGGARCAACSAV
jgi:hypothetical protein